MKALALSTFDSIEGPVVHFIVTDGFVDETLKAEISGMLSLNVSTDYFLFRVGKSTSYNRQFNLRSMHARGKQEMLMLSLVTEKFPDRKVETFFLKEADRFVSFIKKEPYADMVFHLDKECTAAEFDCVEKVYSAIPAFLKDVIERFI
nr:hypothetical protein [Candidatus Sigynarchaeota archaeon]